MASRVTSLKVFAILAALLIGNVAADAQELTPAQQSRRSPIVDAVRKTRDSVVAIKMTRRSAYGTREVVGTGVLVDERGYIVTNHHVVDNAETLCVVLYDKTEHRCEIIKGDASADMAIIRIKANRKLPCLKPAEVDDLMVGETVIAIGHPFGYTNTVSTGIVSALGREITLPAGYELAGLIQTDASINPGSSGGPLLNINGEMVGVNVAMRDGAQCIAFAINAGKVRAFIGNLNDGRSTAVLAARADDR